MTEETRKAIERAREVPIYKLEIMKEVYEHALSLAVGEIEKQIALTKAYHDKWDEITDKYLESQSRIDLLKQAIDEARKYCADYFDPPYIPGDLYEHALSLAMNRISILETAMKKAIEKCNNCENSYIIADILQQALDGKEEGK